MSRRPIVVIPGCSKRIDDYTFDAVSRQYSAAVAQVAECQPLIIPLDTALVDLPAILAIADGILLSGSPSNVHPSNYSEEAPILPDKVDPARDALTLPLIRIAKEEKVPLFAICRGVQEVNVALGGTLHQAVQEQPGHMDHRERKELALDERWAPKHPIRLEGQLRDWIGKSEIMVNSLHGQGLRTLAKGLTPEAFAEDGLVEAVRGPEDHPFFLGVQWHPEWKAQSNPVSQELFRRFGAAIREQS
ncbi:MAG: gamma-glutamyl-gamma-aminobutyrate hydrolase family protein [Hyphomicrobium sp.]|nr:gamma-glutamyl-gamma-aminobutyrate hydrolase family protein [Hyphomicrobium sp.]